ncbi:MAG: SLATT domain-containing protein [Syntrophomonas sp.]|nr:SLATT domain-containing protein [Syntrophomonas sp.]
MSISVDQKINNLLNEVLKTGELQSKIALKYAKKQKIIRLSHLVLTVITTILLGLKLGEIGQNLAFVFSAVASGIATWVNFDTSKKKELQQVRYLNSLVFLGKDIYFYKENYDHSEEKFNEFVARYQKIREEYYDEMLFIFESEFKNKKSIEG